jgi:cyanophycin synthetase
VDGDGTTTIRELVERENATVARLDNARSPLCKIKVDEDLKEYLRLQGRSLETVPSAGERVTLRRVANISAGGVSVNVTDRIHPANVRLVEDIAKFFRVTCLGIDVLAEDISRPWTDGRLGIIEINAGPGVFMHLAPAVGEPVDVPGMIMRAHFPRPGADRVPIIAGNRIGLELCNRIYQRLRASRPSVELGSLTAEGVHFNGEHFHNNPRHDQNVRIILRNPKLDLAVFSHSHDDLVRFGIMHQGADVVVLDDPDPTEEILARDLLPDGTLVRLDNGVIRTTRGGREVATRPVGPEADRDQALFEVLEPLLDDLLVKYD